MSTMYHLVKTPVKSQRISSIPPFMCSHVINLLKKPGLCSEERLNSEIRGLFLCGVFRMLLCVWLSPANWSGGLKACLTRVHCLSSGHSQVQVTLDNSHCVRQQAHCIPLCVHECVCVYMSTCACVCAYD